LPGDLEQSLGAPESICLVGRADRQVSGRNHTGTLP
jgi:hypothetical protein